MSAPWYDPQGVEKTRRTADFATPALPASGTPITNQTGSHVWVVVNGGTTVTAITVAGKKAAGNTDQGVIVPAGKTIAVTYTGTPTWTWTVL